jgi:uncharacterized protein (DUF362 family)
MMPQSKVIIIKSKKKLSGLDQNQLIRMFQRGLLQLSMQSDLRAAINSFFPQRNKIGIKINTIGGKKLSTQPETSLSLAKLLAKSGIPPENILIWDRSNRELRAAGYSLKMSRKGFKIFGTDSQGIGYDRSLTSHLSIGSLFSSIQTKFIDLSISLAVLKDHGLAGVTASMKNYFGSIHNPNKYHDHNCNPYVAELCDTSPVKAKHKLAILDATLVQYHRGPSFHKQWAYEYKALIFGTDPVAVDYTGWQIIEKLRAVKGLPSLAEENRTPLYIKTAEKLGLGTANHDEIRIVEEEI